MEKEYPVIKINESEYCLVNAFYEADPEIVQNKRKECIETIKTQLRKAKVSGFRKGRIPDDLIKVKYKKEIDNLLVNILSSNSIDDIVFEHNIKIIGQPTLKNVILEKNNFSCEFVIYKYPEINLSSYKEFDIVKQTVSEDEAFQIELKKFNDTYAEISDESASAIGIDKDKLLDVIREVSKKTVVREQNARLTQQVIDYLLNNNNFKIPEFLINSEAYNISRNIPEDKISENIEIIKQTAEKNIKLSLVLETIRDIEPESTMTSTELEKSFYETLKNIGVDLSSFVKDKASVDGLIHQLKDDFTIQWIISTCKEVTNEQ